jgi:beta-barrel assembly-enhancing protease
MGRIFIRSLVVITIFFSIWFLLGRIDYVKHLHLENLGAKTEKKVGDAIMQQVRTTNDEITSDSVSKALDDICYRLCSANNINPDTVHLHLIHSSQINAFALPGNHIVIYTGLINQCDSASELCGVLSHELAHLQLHHVSKRIANEIGISVMATVATNGNAGVVHAIIKMLSSSAYERSQESEADMQGVKYLKQAGISPKGFADIMFKIADQHIGASENMEWLSSHPDSKKRAFAILSEVDSTHPPYKPVLDDQTWGALKNAAMSTEYHSRKYSRHHHRYEEQDDEEDNDQER